MYTKCRGRRLFGSPAFSTEMRIELKMNTFRIKAYAKINLGLDVLRRRPDGYHEVKMIMQTVDLYDDLEFTKLAEDEIRIFADKEELPADQGNLIWRADAQAGPVHPHHGFGHAGEPSARRSHHERGAQLFERTVDGTPGFEIRLVDSGGGVRTVRRMADHPPPGAAYAGPCGGVGLSSPARVGGLSKFWKVIERLIWKKS